jgi:hypothetical protein
MLVCVLAVNKPIFHFHTPVGGFRVFVLFMSRQPVFVGKLLFALLAPVGFAGCSGHGGGCLGGISVSVTDKLIGHLQPLPILDKPWLLGIAHRTPVLGLPIAGKAYKMTEGLVEW